MGVHDLIWHPELFWSMAADPRNTFRCSMFHFILWVKKKTVGRGCDTYVENLGEHCSREQRFTDVAGPQEATISNQIGRRGPESCHGTRGIVSLQIGGETVSPQEFSSRCSRTSCVDMGSLHCVSVQPMPICMLRMVNGVVDMCAGFLAQTTECKVARACLFHWEC